MSHSLLLYIVHILLGSGRAGGMVKLYKHSAIMALD